MTFNAKTGEYYREKIELPFFEYHLKGKGDGKLPKAWVFETGTNVWRKFDAWPPKDAKPTASTSWTPAALLGATTGRSTRGRRADGFDEFVSDPAKPVPYIDKTAIGMAPGVHDGRPAVRRAAGRTCSSTRPPVLDEDLTIAGPIEVELHVSTTGTDADWVVKLIDVYPDDFPDPDPNPTQVRMGGYQQLVRGDVMRGKFRNSFEKPEPFEPGEVDDGEVHHAGRPAHVPPRAPAHGAGAEHWFPLVDRNPQTFCDIYTAKEADFRKATHRVYRTAEHPSRVTLPVVPNP